MYAQHSKELGVDNVNGKITHIQTMASTYIIGKTLNQAILFITSNKMGNLGLPSIFVLPRTTGTDIKSIYEGNCVKLADLSMNADGSVTVSGISSTHLYYRLYSMEMNS